MCKYGFCVIRFGSVYYDPVLHGEIASGVGCRGEIQKFQTCLLQSGIGTEQPVILHIVIQVNPLTQRILPLQPGRQVCQFLKTLLLRLWQCFPCYQPVKKALEVLMPRLAFQQA